MHLAAVDSLGKQFRGRMIMPVNSLYTAGSFTLKSALKSITWQPNCSNGTQILRPLHGATPGNNLRFPGQEFGAGFAKNAVRGSRMMSGISERSGRQFGRGIVGMYGAQFRFGMGQQDPDKFFTRITDAPTMATFLIILLSEYSGPQDNQQTKNPAR